jgi:hypothetical protein
MEPMDSKPRSLLARISRLELTVAVVVAAVLLVLVLLEPDILEAPFASGRAIAVTLGGTVVALVALAVMISLRVPALLRVAVLGVPFLIASWWLIEPYFVDDVVDDAFEVSINDSASSASPDSAASTPDSSGSGSSPVDPSTEVPSGTGEAGTSAPTLISSGSFIGLAGHEGRGDAGIFQLPDGGHVLRFENFDIENGPDLRVYLVPGESQTEPVDGSIGLGELRGNVGDQTYELPDDFVPSGPWTALVWCEAFSVEFVGATLPLD